MQEYLNAIATYHAPENAMQYLVNHIILVQHGLKKGIKIFGESGLEAIQKEMQQFNDRKVIIPVNPKDLSKQQKNRALNYLMFLRKKRDGSVKGRGCADRRKQRIWNTSDLSAPTVSIEAVFLSCAIDAKEGWEVATCDIPSAFLQTPADKDDEMIIRLDRQLARTLLNIDPDKYGSAITYEKGNPVIYGRANKAIYGSLSAALLFWKNLSGYLVNELGFRINPYDRCVANKVINGHICTVLWHVDDIKISSVSVAAVDDVLKKIDDKYGQEVVQGKKVSLVTHRGKVHKYLGMTISFEQKGKVKFTMYDYIYDLLEELPDDFDGLAEQPASSNLFNTDHESPSLNFEKSEQFHHLVAKVLFLSRRARPDLQTTVSFLCTRVQQPTQHDWMKLRRRCGTSEPQEVCH